MTGADFNIVSEGRSSPSSVGVRPLAALWRHRGTLLFFLDAVTVGSSFMLAYYLRFYAEFLAIKRVPVVEVGSYLKGAALLTAVWVFLIWRDGGYETGFRGMSAPMLRIRALFMSGVYALVVLMVISYMYRGLLLSRQVYLMTGVFACVTMVLVRVLFRAVNRDLAAQGVAMQHIVVVGMGPQALEFVRRLDSDGSAIRFVGFLSWQSDEAGDSSSFADLPVLGALADARTIHAKCPFDTVVLSSLDRSGAQAPSGDSSIMEILNLCEEKRISLYVLPKSFDIAVSQQEMGSFSGAPMIRLQDASSHPVYGVTKRMMDVSISAIGIAFGAPIWLVIAVLTKLTSNGPVLFVQTRAGLHGKPFRIYKFRTMVHDAETRLKSILDIETLDVPGFKIRDDPRATPFGRFLRRTSLDEIPQLINVVKGEMSLVGPRPEMLDLVARYTPEQRRRLKAKPGITGYQQIMARGIPLASGLSYDLIYLKHQSFFLDVYILLKTLVVVVRGAGVTH